MNEAQFQATVIELAKWHKWRIAHFRSVQTPGGRYLTPMAGDVGYPDLTMVRRDRLIFAELKSERGRLHPAQQEWVGALQVVSASTVDSLEKTHVEVFVWRPRDMDYIRKVLA